MPETIPSCGGSREMDGGVGLATASKTKKGETNHPVKGLPILRGICLARTVPSCSLRERGRDDGGEKGSKPIKNEGLGAREPHCNKKGQTFVGRRKWC